MAESHISTKNIMSYYEQTLIKAVGVRVSGNFDIHLFSSLSSFF